jgi:glycine/D-amino acid oxidase-like deaminating enzyme
MASMLLRAKSSPVLRVPHETRFAYAAKPSAAQKLAPSASSAATPAGAAVKIKPGKKKEQAPTQPVAAAATSDASLTADAVVIGAGLVGLSTATHLQRAGLKSVKLIDPRYPGTFTSNRSTECFRAWWPNETMMSFVRHSIQLLDQLETASKNSFHMSQRGYLFYTTDEKKIPAMLASAQVASDAGSGALRTHHKLGTYVPQGGKNIDGLDIITDPQLIRSYFPYLPQDAKYAQHVRRCGFVDTQKLADLLLKEFRLAGGQFISGECQAIQYGSDKAVESVLVRNIRAKEASPPLTKISTPNVVIAAGPYSPLISAAAGVKLPLRNEIHAKVIIDDVKGHVPRDAPLILLNDEVNFPLTAAERAFLSKSKDGAFMTKQMAPGVHFRPFGFTQKVYGIWTYESDTEESSEPLEHPHVNPYYGEAVLRGMAQVLPGLREYFRDLSKPNQKNPHIEAVKAGYYTKAPDNRPLIGPLGPKGLWGACGLSGYGIMGAQAAGHLAAYHVSGSSAPAPSYSKAFLLSRFSDPTYVAAIANAPSGQL